MLVEVKSWARSHEVLLVCFLALVFVFIRLPGTSLPLHQDEYKWPGSVDPANPGAFIPHPPIGAFIYETAGHIVGYDIHFRFVPLFFGTLNLLLLYYLARFLFGRREAVIAGLIWIFSYFSVLASLMVDTDGEIMPFFFLIALIGYFKLRYFSNKKYLWGTILAIGLLLGIFDKLSFILSIGAIAADFLWSRRRLLTRRAVLKYGGYSLLGICIFIVLLFVSRSIFPFFDLERSFTYWKHFIVFDRGWFQTFIQCAKALLYSSPFLVLLPFLLFQKDFISTISKEKVRVFAFFLLFAFIFYVLLFDFSIGALDRYLQLLVLPLTVFGAVIISTVSRSGNPRQKEFLLLGIIVSLLLILLQSIPHFVPPLHPKSEWISRLFSFKWNFVYPFSGGSGPLGFYVSFLFMALSWIFSAALIALAIWKPKFRTLAVIFLLPIGIAYNGVFIEEYLFGFWNGHAATLVYDSADFIRTHPEIKKVIVYNDNGAEEVRATGTYFRRLYADPAFVEGYKDILSRFDGHILYIDVPRVDPASIYKKYFDSCTVVYEKTDRKMTARIYDCRNVSKTL